MPRRDICGKSRSHVIATELNVVQRMFKALSVEEREGLRQQINEDTCTKHNVFCCPQCFNMEPTQG
jgi:galactose-1-phosphate uridylyltransferase